MVKGRSRMTIPEKMQSRIESRILSEAMRGMGIGGKKASPKKRKEEDSVGEGYARVPSEEFIKSGALQTINSVELHPAGMELVVRGDGSYDVRYRKEGEGPLHFAKMSLTKSKAFDKLIAENAPERIKELGYVGQTCKATKK